MAAKKRLALAAAIAALIVFLLAVFAAVVAPRLLDSRSVRDAIQREVSSRTGADFTLGSVELELLPLPRLKVFSPRLIRGTTVSAGADALILYPRLLSLLKGKIEIARLRLNAPSAALTVDAVAEAGKDTGPSLSPEAAVAAFASGLAWIRQQIPDLSADVAGGTLVLKLDDGAAFRFEQIDAALSTAAPRFELSCRSDLWERLRVEWTLGEHPPSGKAQITVFHLRPERLVNRMLSESGPVLSTARGNLNVEILPGKDGLPHITFSGSLPEAVFQKNTERVSVSADSFSGSLQPEKDRALLVIDRWEGKTPAVDLSVRLGFDRRGGSAVALRDIQVRGTDIDAAAVKTPALFFAGGKAALDNVFDVIRGGEVTDLMIEARIPGSQQPFVPEDFRLEGKIEDGAVHIPGIDLDLASVAGAARIENGLLTVESLEAVYGNVSGTDGSLTLSLFDGNNRFGLDIGVDAGLSGLAENLARLIGSPQFSRRVETIRSLEGRAEGRLFLGETLDEIRSRVAIDRLSAEVLIDPLSTPLTISGSGIDYRDESISAASLDLAAEGLHIGKISGSLSWDRVLRIEAVAASARLQIDPVLSWMPQLVALEELMPGITFSGGKVDLSAIEWRGPIFSPSKWDYDAHGILHSVQVSQEGLPAPVRVSLLAFHAGPDRFESREFQIAFLDAALSGSGYLQGRPHAVEGAELRLEGRIGPEADRWILAQSRIPAALTLQVHQVSDARVHWNRTGELSVSGHLLLNRDTRLSVNLDTGPDRFDLKQLSIEDPDSRVEVSLRRTVKALEFAYRGRLSSATIDRLVLDNQFLGGWIRGGVRGRIDLEIPIESEIEGRLEIEGLAIPVERGPRIRVAKASLYGETHRLDIERLDVRLDDDPFEAKGEVFRRKGGFDLNASVTAPRIDLNRWHEILAGQSRETGEEEPAAGRIPVEGTVRIEADTVMYGEYRFEAVDAEVRLLEDRTEVGIQKGRLCGISVPAEVAILPDSISLQVRPQATDGRLAETSNCLLSQPGQMEGRFSLNGSIAGVGGDTKELISSLRGNVNFNAQKGVIQDRAGFGILRQVLALINVTEIFSGALPEFRRSGFGYNAIQIKSEVEEGVLHLREVVIDGRNMNLTAQGEVGLSDRRLNMTVLVAPLKTVDRIVGAIPLVRDILEGTLVSIPVRVRGTLDDPKAEFLPPSTVGKGLIGIAERTLKLPLKIVPGRP